MFRLAPAISIGGKRDARKSKSFGINKIFKTYLVREGIIDF